MLVSRIKDEVSRTETGSNEKLYVSETDALTGWITQTVALSEPRLRPFTILNLINSRYHLGPLQNPNSVYLQNTVLITYTLFSAQEARGAAAALALAHREQAAEQTTQSRVISFIQWLGKQIENDKNSIALCGETDSVLLSVNALTRADLIKGVDFAPAVLRQGEAAETRDNPPGGTLMHIFSKEANAELAPINLLAVIGKDYKDRTLLMGNMLPQAWEHLEQQVKLLP